MSGMKLAGIATERMGYSMSHPDVFVAAVFFAIGSACRQQGVEPIGSLSVYPLVAHEGWPGYDVGVRWELDIEGGGPPPPPGGQGP